MPTRRFFLEGLECACRIGAYDHERLGPQRVIIDAEILLADGSEPQSDSLDEPLNYDLIRNAILEISGSRHFDLQETLARELYDALGALPGVAASCDSAAWRHDYFGALFPLNPGGIVPTAPELSTLVNSPMPQS